jgi:hypothetical protein
MFLEHELRSPNNRLAALEYSSYMKSGVGDSARLIGRCKLGARTHIVIFHSLIVSDANAGR